MAIGDINRDKILAIQNGARQSVNRSSAMTYLHSGYDLYEMVEGTTTSGAPSIVPGKKIIGPDDIRAVVAGTARVVPIE